MRKLSSATHGAGMKFRDTFDTSEQHFTAENESYRINSSQLIFNLKIKIFGVAVKKSRTYANLAE